ncbi:MAG TPA: hypothetical protein VGZ90_14630 [Puia sp.]|jgi:hypothetical protein|nr:hypothetical protein [Puia sp.]
MGNLPLYTIVVFIVTTGFTIFLFYRASNYSFTVFLIVSFWLVLQVILPLTGFYQITDTIPPREMLFILPPLLFIIILFLSPGGRRFIDQLDPGTLTLLHTVRIPVEFVLYWLYLDKQVPKLMTFVGGNYDIISGMAAPIVFYFGFVKKLIGRRIILLWNLVCLILLFLVVRHAILSVPSPFQKFGFDQPNIAILHFPYTWLPSFIVPMVLFSHLAMIRRLTLAGTSEDRPRM